MTEKVVLQVTRYRPEQETEPTIQEYEVGFTNDWVLLETKSLHLPGQADESTALGRLAVWHDQEAVVVGRG